MKESIEREISRRRSENGGSYRERIGRGKGFAVKGREEKVNEEEMEA